MSRQARALDVLLAEVNAAAPNRSKVSDGGLGDQAHASRASDHNPNAAGVWRARDFTNDPAGDLDCNELAVDLAGLLGTHPALQAGAYVIWNRRIISTDRRADGWRTYTGSNPHDHHCHVSVGTNAASYDSTAPWGVMKEQDEMARYEDQLDRIEAEQKSQAKDIAAIENSLLDFRRAMNARSATERARDLKAMLELKRQGKTDDEILAKVSE